MRPRIACDGTGADGAAGQASSVKGRKESASPEEDLAPPEEDLHCLACGRSTCPFEDGHTVLDNDDGQQCEFDQCQPSLRRLSQSTYHFDFLKPSIKGVVQRMLLSDGFWSRHKFLGSARLELRVRTWMKNKLNNPDLVDMNWCPLRMAVKETLRYKRQCATMAASKKFIGESVASQQQCIPATTTHLLCFQTWR